MQRGDTVIAQMAGFSMERRLSPPDSKEARTAAEHRRVLEWRVSAARQFDEPMLPWLRSARARARIAQMRAIPREEDLDIAILRKHKMPLEPPEDHPMIDLYYWPTPNGHKITMLLEETRYAVPPGSGEHRQGRTIQAGIPRHLSEQPHARRSSITSRWSGGAPISVFESGAILLYLAQKSEQFIPESVRGSTEVIEWLFWQVAGLGPMAGQNHHFSRYAPEKIPYAIERYVKETNRSTAC